VPDLGRPERSQDVGVEPLHHGIDLGADRLEVIGPAGEDASGTDHPPHLGVETVVVEPVQGEGDGHEIDGGILERSPFGGGDEVGDLGVGMSLGDLLRAGVGGNDGTKVGSQPEGCLPVAGGAVPGEVVGGTSEAR
jgi:hypothetical protein